MVTLPVGQGKGLGIVWQVGPDWSLSRTGQNFLSFYRKHLRKRFGGRCPELNSRLQKFDL